MKKIILLSVGIIFSVNGFSQVTFQRTYGTTSSFEGYAVQQTEDGGYIIAANPKTSSQPYAYLIKTDSNGDTLWSSHYRAGYGYLYSVKQTIDGGFIAAGYDGFKAYLLKTDSNGNLLWSKLFGGTPYSYAYSVTQSEDSGFVIAGVAHNNFVVASEDFLLVKTDANGNLVWSNTYGGNNIDLANYVERTNDHGYIVTGNTSSFGVGNSDVYLVKTDAAGNLSWSRTFGGNDSDEGHCVQQTSDGGYIIAGKTLSFGSGNWDIFVIKTDSSGNLNWSKTYGGASWDDASTIKQTNDGGYIIAGYANYDVVLIKIDGVGNMMWNNSFGGTGLEIGSALDIANDGGYAIVGQTSTFSTGYIRVYFIKTDSIGNSGCNEMTLSLSTTIPTTQTINPATIVSAINATSIPNTVVGRGIDMVKLCYVGIDEGKKEKEYFLISPNPAINEIGITNAEFRIIEIEIYDVMGKKIKVLTPGPSPSGEESASIDVSKLTPGIYFVKVKGETGERVAKFVKQ
ncbi:MAG: T9SS type A sorting domain-containing protein [Bacteroidia bacterium]|nr:T9SS type A sorting domain-containing protein [Bacteroidia bacterium]